MTDKDIDFSRECPTAERGEMLRGHGKGGGGGGVSMGRGR